MGATVMRARRGGSTSSATTPTTPAASCSRWPSIAGPRSAASARRRPRGSDVGRRGASASSSTSTSPTRPASSRRGAATSPAWSPRARRPVGFSGHGDDDDPGRCRPVVERRPRGGGRPRARLSRGTPPTSLGLCQRAEQRASGRAVRDHGPAGVASPASRVTRCSSTATRSTSRRSRSRDGGRVWSCTPAHPRAGRVRVRRTGAAVRAGRAGIGPLRDGLARRRATLQHPVVRPPGPPRGHRERAGRPVRRRPRGRRPRRRRAPDGRQPRQPARRLRGLDAGAGRRCRRARRAHPGCTGPASPGPASAAASSPSPAPVPCRTAGSCARSPAPR